MDCRLSASLPTRASLAALIAQSEFGDSSVSVDYDEYVRACTEGDELGEKLKILHAAHKGMNEGETEMAYLNECKDLSTYGVWQFPAKVITPPPPPPPPVLRVNLNV